MEIEKAKSLDIARLLAFWGLMNGNNATQTRKALIFLAFRPLGVGSVGFFYSEWDKQNTEYRRKKGIAYI